MYGLIPSLLQISEIGTLLREATEAAGTLVVA